GLSPIQELLGSFYAMTDPARERPHRRFVPAARRTAGELRLRLLPTLVLGGHLFPDFLLPSPGNREPGIEDEVERVRSSEPGLVRAAMDDAFNGDGVRGSGSSTGRDDHIPVRLRPLYGDPERELPQVADELHAYWRAVLLPAWPRVRSALEADLAHRAERMSRAGLSSMLRDLHGRVGYWGDHLTVDGLGADRIGTHGTGLRLVASLFITPKVMLADSPADPPMITYPVRGSGSVWTDSAAAREDADPLSDLLGRTRARILRLADLPASTAQLAGALELTAATVSAHLGVLRSAGLVGSRRSGRFVYYQQTDLARRLCR
ncbi:MAG: winged helix-turn-helix transcriptional regulator, partial [Nonomuraea sp.]|nr:winged helix-turn-helix transcriptional regulator [Nonomuraea sp.]